MYAGMNEEPQKNILDWDENDVQAFFAKLGYPQYEVQIREHNISGDVLCMLDADTLKEVGVATVGQRLAILKAVYLEKLVHDVPIEDDQYVPPSEAEERNSNVSVDKLYTLVRSQEERLHHLEDENHRLRDSLHSCMEDLSGIRSSYARPSEDSLLRRQPSFKWAHYKPNQSPTKASLESPQPSPQRMEHDTSYNARNGSQSQQTNDKWKGSPADNSSGAMVPVPPKPVRQESSDNLKSFKVSLDDPAWKVLPAALKKYKINNDDWQNYAMFICYGSSGNRIERCLSFDEKPLLLFQKLKDAKKNPVFMLKHIKDIRSPIAVAQQKQAARKASESSTSGSGPKTAGGSAGQGRSTSRPSKLQVHDPIATSSPPLLTGMTSAQGGWPEIMSPAAETKERSEEVGLTSSTTTTVSGTEPLKTKAQENNEPNGIISTRENMVASAGMSYAVAIYPYMAEQEDEFDVVVGDTFIILSRARGWWVVQRDPAGTGAVEPDMTKQGWVPAGCLLETNIPVASAVAEANALRGPMSDSSPSSPQSKKTPILPLSIVSTSFPGIALMDYEGKGDEELDLMKDDALRVFKRYNHWSYAVKEEGGDRGWVPSWYIGKISATGATPATPSTSHPPAIISSSMTLDAMADSNTASQQLQVSPMSSAFPPVAKTTPLL
ncbi:hypothetical protein NEOLEDRAFT_1239967 [Neolentinus lepideus HHB14362 ss-1]|uniref:RA-domain-containing protein n=1 Tax=Neolentinus lepideus HHB14362 ss-1 TaxID=1314782 RepID=A0A165U8V5_9AGAM|nr:hypothetical protein NEOLEDRAFT_1239967 [Neolentinus lepideus HHB14362 ss-1]